MGRPEGFDDVVSDPYTSETSGDIYNTPDVIGDKQGEETARTIETDEAPEHEKNAELEEVREPAEATDSAVQQSGGVTEIVVSEDAPEIGESEDTLGIGVSDEKAHYDPSIGQNMQGGVFSGNSHDSSPYEDRHLQSDNPYGSNPYAGQFSQYGDAYGNYPYGSQQPQDSNSYSNHPYGNQQTQNGIPYSNNPYEGQQHQNGFSYGSQQPQGGNPYSNPYEDQYTQNEKHYSNTYAGVPPHNNPYSPYAVPTKKNNTKLIIGIVAGIIILFLIAVFALTYKVISLISEERDRQHRSSYEEYEFHDDREENREKRREENDFGYDDQNDYNDNYYDDDYDDYYYNYDYDNDQYYTLHDDIRENLSYTVNFEYYEYDTDDEDVAIVVTYPVIEGNGIPNLDQLNGLIQSEIDLFKDFFEDEYINYMDEEDSYFSAVSSGYVTYMDEEKMSIVFSESVSSDYYNYAYLYCINIDMENGVVLDNENILGIDDNFSVEFRNRSDIQNGEIPYLTYMTDQEITGYFNSSDVIVFYTPHGMEIGFNYEEGWVTVTYEEYEQYLKVF